MKKLLLVVLLFASAFANAQYFQTPTQTKRDGTNVTVGMVFTVNKPMLLRGVRFYQNPTWSGYTDVHAWDVSENTLIDIARSPAGSGWQSVMLPAAVILQPGKEFIVSYCNSNGWYNYMNDVFPVVAEKFNGVGSRYVYECLSLPTQTYRSSNYYVEPVLDDIVNASDTVVVFDTVYVRDTVYLEKIDSFVNVIYMEGRDTLTIDRSPIYTSEELQKTVTEGIWQYEFRIGAQKYRFVRSFVWRRQYFENGEWKNDD